ncbi:MAG TPA: hypothetical protein VMW40_01830 [Candidatus Bathyarchaeia archaeon]|nr:hypothetical protein [Candidatus Bathyarchaeia archaeon]
MMNKKILITVGILVIFLQILFFRFISHWGDGLAPIYIPAIVTFFYALWSKEGNLSFLFGFWSLMAMFMGPMLFYMELPPMTALIPILGLGVIFGFLGTGIAFISKRLTCG